jgi:hypothetical protein
MWKVAKQWLRLLDVRPPNPSRLLFQTARGEVQGKGTLDPLLADFVQIPSSHTQDRLGMLWTAQWTFVRKSTAGSGSGIPTNCIGSPDCQVWAPTHIGQYLPDDGSNFLLSELFPLALQQKGLFEALVAWSQCFSSTYYKQDTFLAKEVLCHRGNAIAELRTSLMPSSRFSSDAAIMALLFLMGVDVSFI